MSKTVLSCQVRRAMPIATGAVAELQRSASAALERVAGNHLAGAEGGAGRWESVGWSAAVDGGHASFGSGLQRHAPARLVIGAAADAAVAWRQEVLLTFSASPDHGQLGSIVAEACGEVMSQEREAHDSSAGL